jgi:hypothetical protein
MVDSGANTMTETTLLTDPAHTRGDLRQMESAIRKGWALSDKLLENLPKVLVDVVAKGSMREKIAAARVLVAMKESNDRPTTPAPAPVVNVGVQVNGSSNTDAGRTLASAIAERIRANRISQQPAG